MARSLQQPGRRDEEGVSDRLLGPCATLLCNGHAATRRPSPTASQTSIHSVFSPPFIHAGRSFPNRHVAGMPHATLATLLIRHAAISAHSAISYSTVCFSECPCRPNSW